MSVVLKSYVAKTDQGPYLNVNEDNYEVDLINNLFLVFDGFGGAGIGDQLTDELKNIIKEFYLKIGGDPDATLPFYFSPKYLVEGNALINASHLAHQRAIEKNRDRPMDKRGGASGALSVLVDSIFTFVTTGNLGIFLLRRGELRPVLIPDFIGNYSDDLFEGSDKTTPMSGFGLFSEFHFQTKELRVAEDDTILILTDGVYSKIRPFEMKSIVDKTDKNNHDIVDSLFELANNRGNLDNQTAILLRF